LALDTLRKGTSRFLGLLLIGLLVISFAVWGIADVFTGYGAQTLIRVGDTEITGQDYLRAQRDVLRGMSAQAGRSLSLQEAREQGLAKRVVERLIGGAAVDTHARHLGLGITEPALLMEIKRDPAFKDSAGAFSPLAFQQVLREAGLTEQGYLISQRERNMRRQLLSTVGAKMLAPEILVTVLSRFNDETRSLRYVIVEQSSAGSAPEPSEGDLKRYYDNHQATFTKPEFRKLGILAVTPETVRDEVDITEEELKAAYEAEKAKLGTPERRQVQQIIFPDREAAEAAHKRIQEGTDFTAIAKERGLGDADINLGNLKREELAESVVAEAAFALEQDKVSEPVTGKLGGTVLLRVTAIEEGNTPSFEDAKADLEKKILAQRAEGLIFDLHDRIEDERAAGASLAEIAIKLKLDQKVIDQLDRKGQTPDGSTPELPSKEELLNFVFTTDVGVENDPLDLKDQGMIWYEVLGVTPRKVKPFDQVKDEVAKDWRSDENRSRLAKYAQGLVNSLAGGKSLDDLATELNTQVLPTEPLKRRGLTVNVLPSAVAQVFTLPEGGYGSARTGTEGQRIVFQVEKVTPPPPLDPRAVATLKAQLDRFLADDIVAEYFGALENRYGVSLNQAALAKLAGTSDQP
jgi:peptidyl-prolyl cis-trans isomerase D